jgi:hypothetical protein
MSKHGSYEDNKYVADCYDATNEIRSPSDLEFHIDYSRKAGGRKFRRTGRLAGFHHAAQYNDVELIYYVTSPDGKTERYVQAFPMRYFFRYEIEHLLELTDLKVVDLFGDFDKSAYSGDSPEMIFIAEKAG